MVLSLKLFKKLKYHFYQTILSHKYIRIILNNVSENFLEDGNYLGEK